EKDVSGRVIYRPADGKTTNETYSLESRFCFVRCSHYWWRSDKGACFAGPRLPLSTRRVRTNRKDECPRRKCRGPARSFGWCLVRRCSHRRKRQVHVYRPERPGL